MRTLERHFDLVMGKSPSTWLSEYRQRRALDLLQEGCTVKETAASLGYTRANNFSRDFRKYWSCSPTVYARKTQPQPLSSTSFLSTKLKLGEKLLD